MKVQRREGNTERRLLIGMMVNSVLLGRIAVQWRDGGLFQSKFANILGAWCVNHHRKYNKAPGKEIQMIFESWVETAKDKTTIEPIERLLKTLSDEYDQLVTGDDETQPLIDLAAKHFNRIKAKKLSASIDSDIENDELDRALDRIDSFGRVEMNFANCIDVLNDREAVRRVFADKQESIIRYPGDLGKFYGRALAKGNFVCYLAPNKRGKCVSEDMEVLLSDGRLRTIQYIVDQQVKTPIVALNETTMLFEPVQISDYYDNGIKECFKMTTRSGREVETTLNHKYLTPDGWKDLVDIKIGDYVAVPKKLDYFGNKSMPIDELRFLAYMLADGGCTVSQANFTKADPEIVKGFKKCCKNLKIGVRQKGISYHLTKCGDLRRKYAESLWKVSSKTKSIPDCIFKCPKEQVAEFLRIFMSCDGYISNSKEGMSIQFGLANEHMLRQVGNLLTRFGIVHKIFYKEASCNGKRFPAWGLWIRDRENVNLFLEEINFLPHKRVEPVYPKKNRSFLDSLPHQIAKKLKEELEAKYGRALFKRYNFNTGAIVHACHVKKTVSRDMMSRSDDFIKNTDIYKKYVNPDIYWDKVKSVVSVGKKQTYDITVPEHHNFVANNCLVHNSFWLIDNAWQAMKQRRRVAMFQCGDLTETQIMSRLLVRAAGRPRFKTKPDKPVHYPLSISRDPDEDEAVVKFEERNYDVDLDYKAAWKALTKVRKTKVKSEESYLKLSVHPNSTLTVQAMKEIFRSWEREGWKPDVVVVDYPDIMASDVKSLEMRDQVNERWKALRSLNQSLDVLLLAATQANAASFKASTLHMSHFSEDNRKLAHVTGMIGINRNKEEKGKDVYRLNWVNLREDDYVEGQCVHVAGCLAIGNPAIRSCF